MIYTTFDPLKCNSSITLSSGNTVAASTTLDATYHTCLCTIGKSTGKWIFELTWQTGGNKAVIGIATANFPYANSGNIFPGDNSLATAGMDAIGIYNLGTAFYTWGTVAGSTGSQGSWALTSVLTCAFDLDNSEVHFYVNGTETPSSPWAIGTDGIGQTFFPACTVNSSSATLNAGPTLSYPVAGYSLIVASNEYTKTLSTSVAPSPQLSKSIDYMKSFSKSLSPAALLSKAAMYRRSFTKTVSPSMILSKTIKRYMSFSQTLSLSITLIKFKTKLVNLHAALSPHVKLQRRISKLLMLTKVPTVKVSRGFFHTFNASLSLIAGFISRFLPFNPIDPIFLTSLFTIDIYLSSPMSTDVYLNSIMGGE